MVKSAAEVKAKMQERVSTAGKYLRQGMAAGKDPLDVISANADAMAKKLQDGVAESVRRGAYQAGIKKAKSNDSWKKSQERAGRHFEERAADMVENSMKDFDARMGVVAAAQNSITSMPTTTRQQRIARGAAYAEAAGKGYDVLYGRK